MLAAAFARYLWPYRDRPHGVAFIVLMGSIASLSFTYAAALLVFDPRLRLALELLVWGWVALITGSFFVFGFTYTGRQRILYSRLTAVTLLVFAASLGLVLTNPLHGLAWHGFELEPAFGAATVSYTPGVGLWLFTGWGYVLTFIGLAVLVETFLSYGSLYRGQTLALIVSTLPPSVTQLVWLFGLGPVPQLNLTPFVFWPTVGLLAYAFFRQNLFELTPVVRRAGERTAIDDLGTPFVIVDEKYRIVNLNEQATRVIGDDGGVLGRRLPEFFTAFDAESEGQTVETVVDGQRRQYAVSTSSVTDTGDSVVGYTVLFQDVTVERRQRQQLSVLNRVLRHNLRNHLNVVGGNIELVKQAVECPEQVGRLTKAQELTTDLVDIAEKAKTWEQILDAPLRGDEPVRMRPLLQTVAAQVEPTEGTVRVDVPDDVTVLGSERALRQVFRNLIENGIEHNDDDPWVEVKHEATDERVRLCVCDNGPGIPDSEVDTLSQPEETPLEHGTGMGLWITTWIVERLGGDLQFDTETVDGTCVVVALRAPASTAAGSEPVSTAD